MRYSILGFNQQKVIEYKITDGSIELKCDLTDLALLNYIIYAQANPNMHHVLDDEEQPCVWLQHAHILEDLPILNITEGTLKNRLVKLRKMNLISSTTIANKNSRGTKTYYRITSFLNDLIFETTSFKNDVISESGHSKMTSNKQLAKRDNKLDNSINTIEQDTFELKIAKAPRQNLYSKCVSDITSRNYDTALQKALVDYLRVRLEMRDKPLYANSWKGLLNKLERDFTERERLQVVYQSIERGYASFFPVIKGCDKKSGSQLDKPWEQGVSCRKATEEENAENERWRAEQRAKGVRVDF